MTEGKIITVSVIIPTYNRSHFVVRAIQSVLDQTIRDFEIIVVDDGSTDNTKEVLDFCYGDKIRYFYQERSGASAARNRGFDSSLGKYIHFLDSDDYFLPNSIEEKFNILEQKPDLGWVFSDCYYINPGKPGFIGTNKNIKKTRKALHSNKDVFDLMLRCYFVDTDTVMMRRTCIESIGGWDEKLESFEDADFFYRMASQYRAGFVDAPLVVETHGEKDSITFDRDRYYRGLIQLIEKTKMNFPKETAKAGYPSGRLQADILNYLGSKAIGNNQPGNASNFFLKSIKACPFQKAVYKLFLTSVYKMLITKKGIKIDV